MTNPLKTLLELLASRSVGEIAESDFSELLSAEAIERLKSASIIRDGEPCKTTACTSCQEEHRIEWNKLPDGRFLAVCDRDPNARPQIVKKEQLTTMQIETKCFLAAFAAAIGAETDIKPLVTDELWEIGTITLAKRKRKLLFLRTNNPQRHLDFIDTLSKTLPVIVFSIHQPPLGTGERTIFLDPTLYSSLDGKGLRIDIGGIEAVAQGSGRRVSLNQNGDLTLDGKTLCNIPRHTVEFSFVERLMQSYGFPVSHAELYRYCTKTHGADSDRTAQKYCNDYRSNITKIANKTKNGALVKKIIVSTKTTGGENAYKIQNPIEKVAVK